MYTPNHFAVTDPQAVHDFVRANGFATLISVIDGVPFASHVPLLLRSDAAGDHLCGHVARANPHWQHWADGAPVLAVFHGAHGYISPAWYAKGPAVPTWNYQAVHATGTIRLVDDPAATLAALAGFYEPVGIAAEIMPAEYVSKLSDYIVAFELDVAQWEGKFKLSQNRPRADQDGVVQALHALGEAELAEAMQPPANPQVSGINHLTLAVVDVARAVRFYVDGLGARLHAQWDGGAYLTVGGQWLCLSLDAAPNANRNPDYTHIAFSVRAEDLQPLTERLQQLGAVAWKDNRSEGDSFYFLDLDGHRLELHVGNLASRLAACRARPYAGMQFF
jgi:transcriptional regulator